MLVPLVGISRSESITRLDVRSYGACGDGVTDDRAAFATVIALAASSGQEVFVPAGIYLCGRDGINPWHLNIGVSNITIRGVYGHSIIKAAAGQEAQVRLAYFDNLDNVTIDGIIFDGNWGNVVTSISETSDDLAADGTTYNVLSTESFPSSGTFGWRAYSGTQIITYTNKTDTSFLGCTGGVGTLKRGDIVGYFDSNEGLNHETQVDPKNHAVMIRGCHNATIRNCQFRDVYGDMIWIGAASEDVDNWSRNILIENCLGNVGARVGVTLGQPCDGVTVINSRFLNCYQNAFDCEPQGDATPVRNVHLMRSKFGSWWNPNNTARNSNITISIVGASFNGGEENMARGIRITDCDIEGCVNLFLIKDLIFSKNRVICDFPGKSLAPVFVDHFCDDVVIDDNYIYDRSAVPASGYHEASIHVQGYGTHSRPVGVCVSNNKIHARGHAGISITSTGGTANAPEVNTATAITATSLTRADANWSVNKWITWQVRIGSIIGTVKSNDATTLQLTGWFTPLGYPAPTPLAGEYTIYKTSGVVDVDNNTIDCTDDGNGTSGVGIIIGNDVSGMRVRVTRNEITNPLDFGIVVTSPGEANPIELLEISDNVGHDDQPVQTFYHMVRFSDPTYINKLIMRNNVPSGPAVIAPISGIGEASTITNWIVNDGPAPQWQGFGDPEGVVSAPVGSTYLRLDGGAGEVFNVKESGGGSTGWIAK